ncbi:ABC transporter permease [Azorhizobium oxalatiphilum]|uniref:ABC transporter permease n=1 Tax=Azorhizobium oxalatiphilum TaxID=980631 RepID=A0A917F4P7_9HYPH|nr:ABC transporter permease subunit [Azorhizobium oxalatiphilum]GGF50081.1 ABC transporter permease [Azorhizobium oxalatiphilum]
MSTALETLAARPRAAGRLPHLPLLGGAALWLAGAALTFALPDHNEGLTEIARTHELVVLQAGVGLLLAFAAIGLPWLGRVGRITAHWAPWLALGAAGLAAWELVTAKLGLLPLPFFAPPQGLLEVYLDDWPRLGISLWHSVKLLAWGYVIGAALGVLTGISIGWWQQASYWIHPVLRFIGPLPATAWLPIAFFAFPSSWSASVFLIALATGFPVTILTWSGIASVNKDYYDIARTLGASERFLVLKVAVPAALPHIFVGLFMGLGASFAVLVVAEMLGVKAGLGWYLSWAQGWAAYANMYAALLVMAVMCSSLITLLFRLRDRVLSWQKELVRW